VETPAPLDAVAADPYAPGRAAPAEPRRGVTPPGSALVFLWTIAALATAGPQHLWDPWAKSLLAEGPDPRLFLDYRNWVLLAAMLGLLWAYLSDRVPVLESRREGYLVVASLLAVVAWGGAALLTLDFVAIVAIGLALTTASAISFASVGGALAEIGRRDRRWGRLSAARMGLYILSGLAAEPLTGVLFQRPIAWSAGTGAIAALSIAVLAFLGLERGPQGSGAPPSEPAPTAIKLTRWLSTRLFWGPFLVMAMGAMPNAVYSRMNELTEQVLRLSETDTMWAHVTGTIGSLAGVGAYWVICQRLPLRKLLPAAVVLDAIAVLAIDGAGRWVGTFVAARALAGFAGTLATCARYDLVLRAAPPGRGAFGVVLMAGTAAMVGAFTTPFVSISIREQASGLRALFLVAGALTALSAVAVLVVPRSLVDSPDGRNPSAA
jgi:MFS family permease